MLNITAFEAARVGESVRAFPDRPHVVKARALAPVDLQAARGAFAAIRAEAARSGRPCVVRAFWKPCRRLGGPERAPTGLHGAIAAGDFHARVNV